MLDLATNKRKRSIFQPAEISALPWSLARGPIPASATFEAMGKRQNVIFIAGSVAVTVALIGVALFSTLLAWIPVANGTDTQRVLVQRGTGDDQGFGPGTTVVALSTDVENSTFLNKLNQNLSGEGSTFQIVAGPGGQIENGKWSSFGDASNALNLPYYYPDTILNREYLAICIEGSCERGKLLTLEVSKIVGEVK